jgi:hypothetical protein
MSDNINRNERNKLITEINEKIYKNEERKKELNKEESELKTMINENKQAYNVLDKKAKNGLKAFILSIITLLICAYQMVKFEYTLPIDVFPRTILPIALVIGSVQYLIVKNGEATDMLFANLELEVELEKVQKELKDVIKSLGLAREKLRSTQSKEHLEEIVDILDCNPTVENTAAPVVDRPKNRTLSNKPKKR